MNNLAHDNVLPMWIAAFAENGTPEAEAVLADKRGDARLVEQIGIGAGLLQIPEDRGGNTGHAVDADVG